jgi:uncharacterized membrane protein YdjX (TVP38/TMEM64 family)
VVVDDAVAFTGGLDLTAHRWDTRDHAPDDPRRTSPSGKPYQPFHDVQIAVDGEAAAALADLARERWETATDERVDATSEVAGADPWPASLEPHVRDVEVGIARTLPAWGERAEVREIETLYHESIAAARRWIYVENQYLTTPSVTDALAARLSETDGPEVVIVGPRHNEGWLEESTMGVLRDRAVRALRGAAAGDRLRVVYPHREGLAEDEIVNVHSKVMVVDDAFARVGSSNLSNRSMGLDSECDLAIEAQGRADVARAIAAFRDDLLAEHLGTSVDRVAAEVERTGSLVRTIDALAGDGPRTLRPIELEASDEAAAAVAAVGAVDPERPVALEELVSRFEAEAAPAPVRHRKTADWLRVLVPAAVLGALALAWRLTPLGDLVTGERLAAGLGFVREATLGPPLASLAFALAALALVPVTALIVAAGLAFDPLTGFAVAWSGSFVAAFVGHALGRRVWRDTVRRLAGDRLRELTQRLARRGIVSTALLRVVPVAPFMVVNLVAGASRVPARDFALGTALGMLPGTALMVAGAVGIRAAWRAPVGPAWLWIGLAVLALLGALALLRRVAARLGAGD